MLNTTTQKQQKQNASLTQTQTTPFIHWQIHFESMAYYSGTGPKVSLPPESNPQQVLKIVYFTISTPASFPLPLLSITSNPALFIASLFISRNDKK